MPALDGLGNSSKGVTHLHWTGRYDKQRVSVGIKERLGRKEEYNAVLYHRELHAKGA